MVNTFLVDPDFAKSASCLDRSRLGKQRVEAYQILCLLEDLQVIETEFQYPRPKGRGLYADWIRELARAYKRWDYRYLVINGQYTAISIEELTNLTKSPGARIVRLGFVYHPIVQMWMGYEQALKEYINAHILEWIKRGYNNKMKLYPSDPEPVNRPKWSLDSELHRNHRAALLKKELSRSETPWYIKMENFRSAGDFNGYVWHD